MRMRRRIRLVLLAVALPIGAVCLAVYAYAFALQRVLVGPEHEFTLPDRPAFLTEELAIAYAREALARDVPDAAAWELHPDGRSTAPDGRRDVYLSRNTLNPNLGSVVFEGPTGRRRSVSVELRGDRMVCQGSWGK